MHSGRPKRQRTRKQIASDMLTCTASRGVLDRALAAGLLAFLVARGKARVEVAVDRAVPATTTVATAPVAAPAPVDQFAAAPTLPTRNSGRIAVDSVDFEGHSLAMWSEPETDTTVIWIDEDEPSVTGVR